LSAAIGSWLAALLLVAIAGAVLLARFHRITLHWDSPSQFELLRYGGKSHFEILFQQMLMRCDYLLIAALLDNQALGYYVMASAAAELLCIVPEAVTTPLMKRLLQQGQGITQLTPLALRLTGTAMLLACLAMALLGEWLIVLLFGEAYRPAYPALLALLPGIFCLGHGSILRLDLLGKQRPGSLSLYTGCAAGLNLALTLALLPHFGIVGAAISSSIAYSTLSLAMLLLYCRLSGVAIGQTLLAFPSDLRMLHAQLRPAT
jgi:O-antigen/teichoic acid export membrane protein